MVNKIKLLYIVMKNSFKSRNLLKSLLLFAIMFVAYRSNGQQPKPSGSGYAPVNGLKIYYEVYGQGKPIVLLHGAFMTIDTNWGQLIPELSKTRKVIAVELQAQVALRVLVAGGAVEPMRHVSGRREEQRDERKQGNQAMAAQGAHGAWASGGLPKLQVSVAAGRHPGNSPIIPGL